MTQPFLPCQVAVRSGTVSDRTGVGCYVPRKLNEQQRKLAATRLQLAIDERNLTRMKVAELSDYDERTIRNVLNAVPANYDTVKNICRALNIDLDQLLLEAAPTSHAGSGMSAPALGGYSRDIYSHYAGEYLTIRPRYADPTSIKCYVTKIYWDDAASCLMFGEVERPDLQFDQSGAIYIPPSSGCLYFLTINKGWVRTVIVSRMVSDQMRGLITSQFNIIGGAYAPVSAPIVYQRLESGAQHEYGELSNNHSNYGRYMKLLEDTVTASYANFAVPPQCAHVPNVLERSGQGTRHRLRRQPSA